MSPSGGSTITVPAPTTWSPVNSAQRGPCLGAGAARGEERARALAAPVDVRVRGGRERARLYGVWNDAPVERAPRWLAGLLGRRREPARQLVLALRDLHERAQ